MEMSWFLRGKKMNVKVIFLLLLFSFMNQISAQKNIFNVKCIEKRNLDATDFNKDEILTKVCKFKNYLTKSIGIADYKGRYSYKYQLFKIKNSDTIPITNTDLFNKNIKELEKSLNNSIKTKYRSNLKIPELRDCMEFINLRFYHLNEFGISFDDKKRINFHIEYGIPSACKNVGGETITIDQPQLNELLNYQ